MALDPNILQISPAGFVSVFVKTKLFGKHRWFWNLARFNSPTGIIIDSNNNLYVIMH